MYHLNLQSYLHQPTFLTFNLERLQQICEERTQFYKILVAANAAHETYSQEWESDVRTAVRRAKLETYHTILKGPRLVPVKLKRNDYVSRCLLMVKYCLTDLDKKFFVAREIEFFRMRYKAVEFADVMEFVKSHEYFGCRADFEEICQHEREELKSKLLESTETETIEHSFEDTKFFCVDFEKVLQLIKDRKCLIVRGKAYLPHYYMLYYLENILVPLYYKQLEVFYLMCRIDESIDDRVKIILNNIELVKEYKIINNTKNNPIEKYEDFNIHANFHYPLCMRNIHEHLLTNHHLKYFMKLQYGVFLKHIGVDAEDALSLFRIEFTKKHSEKVFFRKYSYLFKHIYELVGRTHNYNPSTCDDIINTNLAAGQNYGCPFRHFGRNQLVQYLEKKNVSNIEHIMSLVSVKKFKAACVEFYNSTHRNKVEAIGTPQNYYFLSLLESGQEPELDIFESDSDY